MNRATIKDRINMMRDYNVPAICMTINHTFADGTIIRQQKEVHRNCYVAEITDDGMIKLVLSDKSFVWRAISHIEEVLI